MPQPRQHLLVYFYCVCEGADRCARPWEARGGHQKSSSDAFYFIPLRRVLSLNPELSNLARLAGQKSPRILPSSGFISTDSHVHFYVSIEIRTQIPRLVHQVLAQPLKEY